MKIIPIACLNAQLKNHLQQSNTEPIVITENGKPIAALTLIVDAEELERFLLAYNPQFQQLIEDADRRIEETGGIQHEDFWKLVDDSYDGEKQNAI